MRATKFVESYIDAWNHRDPQAVADHLADDGIYRDIPENVQRSHDELIMSFFDYLNRQRIEYARKRLSEYGGHNNAILNIAFAAGFNSNSAFYAAFKNCIGQTPAQYSRAQLKKSH